MYLKFLPQRLFIVICNLWFISGFKRDLRCSVNPGLRYSEFEGMTFNVMHVVANGSDDALHFLWSTYNLPSVIIVRTLADAELSINYTKLQNFEKEAISFSSSPLQSVGLTFKDLWEFRDDKDTADMHDSDSSKPLIMNMFQWTDVNETIKCDNFLVTAFLQSSNSEECFSKNGTFAIQLSVNGDQVSADEFPHLVFTGNSTQVKILLDNLSPNSSKSRYALELMVFSSALSVEKKWQKFVGTTINDEFSPGVFKTVDLSTSCKDSNCESFLFWRPVSYTGVKPIVANSSDATISDFVDVFVKNPSSIAEIYFNDASNSSVIAFNITFGTPKDGFYIKTLYSTWTMMIGTGSSVSLGLSLTAIIYITVGLGALVMFSLGGGLYILCQCFKKKDDDLLLSEGSIN